MSQQGTVSVPDGERIDDAVLWDYSFSFHLEGDTAFEVTYNGDRTSAYTIAMQDAGGVAEVRVTASAGALPLITFADTTVVKEGDAYRYRTPDGALLTYADAASMFVRTVALERLDILDVQSARAAVQNVSFAEPVLPFVQNAQRIDIGGAPASITVHLSSVLQMLLGNSPFAAQPTSIECRYGYAIGGLPIEAPVVLVARQDLAIGFDEPLIEQVEAAIRQWLVAVQPPVREACLIFALTFWSAITPAGAPLLRLTNLTLPMSDVVL